ncbi:unknown [Clostridium sp. CAG:678]|nr:unknown [Clostridium sp. CAG:678]
MSELSCLHGSKRYVACDDVSEATPLRWGQG